MGSTEKAKYGKRMFRFLMSYSGITFTSRGLKSFLGYSQTTYLKDTTPYRLGYITKLDRDKWQITVDTDLRRTQ